MWLMGRWVGQCSRLKSSNAIWPLQNIPISKQPYNMQPRIENEDVTWSPQNTLLDTRTNKRRALSLIQEVELDGWFLFLHIVPHNSCASLVWVLYFISTFLDCHLGSKPTLQLKNWNLRPLQYETHTRAPILNIAYDVPSSYLNTYIRVVYGKVCTLGDNGH